MAYEQNGLAGDGNIAYTPNSQTVPESSLVFGILGLGLLGLSMLLKGKLLR